MTLLWPKSSVQNTIYLLKLLPLTNQLQDLWLFERAFLWCWWLLTVPVYHEPSYDRISFLQHTHIFFQRSRKDSYTINAGDLTLISNRLPYLFGYNCNRSQLHQRGGALSRQGISIAIIVSRLVFDTQIKLYKLIYPPLFQWPQLCCLQMTKRVVISIYCTFIAQQIVSKFFSHRFQLHWTIVSHIAFCWPQPSTCISNWSTFALVLLRQNSTQTLKTCIYLQVSISKHRGTGKSYKCLKRLLTGFHPLIHHINLWLHGFLNPNDFCC